MKIKLNLSIFLFLALFLLTNQIEIYLLVMLFAFIHELAHLICGMILGFKPNILRIMAFGFCIEFESTIQDYNKKILKSNIFALKEIIVALAGPLINLLLVIIGISFNISSNIIYANLLIFLFNLIPIYPLDGGRILKNILKIFCGNRKSYKYINLINNILVIVLTMISSILILICKNMAILAIISFLWVIICKENRKYYTYNKICKIIDKTCNKI